MPAPLSGRFAPVVIVDHEQPDAAERLDRLAEQGAAGVRVEATSRSPGADPYAIWRAAERLRLPVSCNGESSDFASAAFAELVENVPDLPIVVEHLAGSGVPVDDPWQSGLLRRAFAIGRFPNVYLKFHGLGEFCRRALPTDGSTIPFAQPVPPILDEAARCFGPSRLMWGSDYPPVSSREGHGNALSLPMRLLGSDARIDLNAMFGDAARAVFFPRS